MVRRIFERIGEPMRALARPVRGLHQAAYLLAALTLASQILALLRDRSFAHNFGAGETLDLYYAAFRVPDLVFALVSSLVSAYVIIPRISNLDSESTKKLLSESATFLFGFGGIICIVLCIFMPQFLSYLYPNFTSSSNAGEFVLLARILLIQPILLGISGIFGSVTQVQRRFALFALSPVLYNIGIILGTILFYQRWGLPGIGIGVIVGAVAYLAVNIPVIVEANVVPRFRLPSLAKIMPIIRDSVPRSLALGMGSITALALTSFASKIGTGAISVFTLASNLEAVPLALIGSSYAVAAFPSLSEASSPDKREEFTNILSTSAKHIVLWSIVSLGLIIVLRAHIVRAILGTGAFDWNATRLSAALLAILSVGLAAQGLVLLFSRALYAVHQSWRPFIYQFVGMIFTILLASIFISSSSSELPKYFANFFRVNDVHGTTVLLLALAATLGQIFLAILSLFALRSISRCLTSSILRTCIDGLFAAIVGGAAAYGTLFILGGIASLTTLAAVFTQGFIAGSVGCAFSAITLYLIGNTEFLIMASSLDKLLRLGAGRSNILPPSAEEPIQP